MSPEPTMPVDRTAQWRGAVEMELQDLIKQASHFRAQIDAAKTKLKKDYYAKKMKKVTTEVIRMLNALDTLKRRQLEDSNAAVASGAQLDYVENSTEATPVVEFVEADNEQVAA